MRSVLAVVVILLLVLPTTEAQGTIRVRVTPESESVMLKGGERTDLSLAVLVEYVGTVCQQGTQTAVSLVLEAFPSWAGASIRPQSARYSYPKETRTATLEMLPDGETAPEGGNVTYRIEPFVTRPNATACPSSPSIDARGARIEATMERTGSPPAGDESPGGGGGTSAPSASLVLVALGLGLAGRRRRGKV